MRDGSHPPALFDDERMRTLSALALELAIVAPDVRVAGSDYGRVPWSLIERARAQCEAVGIDWRRLRQTAIATAEMSALAHDPQKEDS
jgi:hypothetical protein